MWIELTSPEKMTTFFACYPRCSLGGCLLFRYFGHAKKFAAPFVEALFGGPCSAEHTEHA